MNAELLQQAACRGHGPDLWFPGKDLDRSVEARLICASCPVQAECLVSAGDVDGIRGGLTLDERRAHMIPAVALERAQRRAGWKPCLECNELFKPSRANHRICRKRCWNRRAHRLRYAKDQTFREQKVEANRRYREEAAAALRAQRKRRYWADPETERARRRERYRLNAERERAAERDRKRRKREAKLGLHAETIETRNDRELVKITNRYPSGEVTTAWEVNCTLCTENLINADRETEARVVLDEPHECPDFADLEADLADLERSNPSVAAARKNLDRAIRDAGHQAS